MQKKLPARPNLEHLRGQAKALLASAKAGDSEALATLAEHHPAPAADAFGLSDAQLAVARKHGYASWPRLVHYVEELSAMEGTWAFTSLETDGSPMPSLAFNRSRLIIDGDRFAMASPEATYEGIFDVGVEVMPHTIDIDFVAGPEAGNSSYGIYELHGDELTICLGFTGIPRPTEFVTARGGGHALEKLRRTTDPHEGVPIDEPTAATTEPVDRAEFEVMTPEHERLEGEWSAISITKDGIPLPSHFAKEGRRIGDRTLATVKFGPQVFMQALTRIDTTTRPWTIDYLHTTGPTEGLVQCGIFGWHGDHVAICFAEPGAPRPTAFASQPGSGHTLSKWRRTAR